MQLEVKVIRNLLGFVTMVGLGIFAENVGALGCVHTT